MMRQRTVRLLSRYRTALFFAALVLLAAGVAVTELPRFTGSLRGFDLRENQFYATKLYADSLFGGGTTIYVTVHPASERMREVYSGLRQLEDRITGSYPDARIVSLSSYYRMLYGAGNPPGSTRQFLDAAAQVPLLREMVGKDRDSFLLLVQVEPGQRLDVAEFTSAVAGKLDGIANAEALSIFHIEESIRHHIVRDLATLTVSVVLLFILLFAYIYRRPGAVAFAATNMVLAVLASLFFISLLRVDLNLVTILVIPIVIVLSLADSVHLLTGYATSEIHGREERLERVLSLYLVPSLFSSLTTAAAFFTFYLYSDSQFLRDFGLITACALMAEFLLTFMVSPLLLYRLDVRKLHGYGVTAASEFLQVRRQAFSVFFIAVLAVSVFFVPRLEFSTSSHVFFPRGSAVEKAHDRFNDQYYSQINLEVLVQGRGSGEASGSRQHLDAYVQELTAAIEEQPEVTGVSSALDRIHLPAALPISVPVENLFGSDNPYFNEAANVHRLVVTFPDADLIEDFHAGPFARLQSTAPENVTISATSSFLVMDAVNEHVSSSLVRSLGTAALAIVLMILILTRSATLSFLCLIPNLVPLGIVTLIFVLFDFDINILTAITAVVCLGLLNDDTIHILYRKVVLGSPLDEVSFSILSTSAILVLGFAIFCMSSFRPVQTFGTISAIVFLFGVASDLTLMPVVIDRWWARFSGNRRMEELWQPG